MVGAAAASRSSCEACEVAMAALVNGGELAWGG